MTPMRRVTTRAKGLSYFKTTPTKWLTVTFSSTRPSQTSLMNVEKQFRRPPVSKGTAAARRNQIVNFPELP